MKKSKLQKLFELINTLSKSEKSYFKQLSTTGKEEKIYLKLFDLIYDLNVYNTANEQTIIDQFSKSGQFSEKINYLYNLILKSLRSKSKQSPLAKLNSYLENIDILYEKALFNQAIDELSRAKKFAYKHELFEGLLNLVNREQVILSNILPNDLTSRIKELNNELQQVLALINEIFEITFLNKRIINFTHEKRVDQITIIKNELNSLKNEHFLSNEYKPKSIRAAILLEMTKSAVAELESKPIDKILLSTNILNYFEKENQNLKADRIKYLTIKLNYFYQCFYSQRLEKFDQLFIELKEEVYDLPLLEIKLLTSAYPLLVIRHGSFTNYNSNLDKIQIYIDTLFDRYQGRISNNFLKVIYYTRACFFCYSQKWDDASENINKCLLINSKLRQDLFIVSHMIYMICLYETEGKRSSHHLKKTARKTYKYISSLDYELPHEKEFCKFFNRIKIGESAKKEELENLFSILNKSEKNLLSRSYIRGYFNFIDWTIWNKK